MVRAIDWVYCRKCGANGAHFDILSDTHFLLICSNKHNELMRYQGKRGYAHTRDEGAEFPFIVPECFAVSGEFNAT